MIIALVTDGIFPFVIGGIQKHSFNLAKHLAHNKVFVEIYSAFNDDNYEKIIREKFTIEENEYINLIRIPTSPSFRFPGHYIWESYQYSSNIWQLLKENINKYGIIYCQGFTVWKTLSINNLNARLKIIANLHGLEMFQISVNLKNRLQNYLLQIPARLILRKPVILISLGGKLTGILKKLKNKESIVLEIPNAVDKEWVDGREIIYQNDQLRFVYIGRNEKRKGLELINTVINKLGNEVKFHLNVIGPLPDKLKLKDCRVSYHGIITDELYLKNILDNSDCLLCPSYSEGMPTVIIEAMARGCAVIATDVGAIRELVSAANGWLIPAGDEKMLKKALLNAIELDSAGMLKKRNRSREIVKSKYTWDLVIEKKITLFNKILKA